MRRRRENPNQTLINWSNPAAPAVTAKPNFPDPVKLAAQAQPPLIQYLPWDFTDSYPQPTDDAVDVGVIPEEDCTPERIKSIHDEHAREALAILRDLDTVMDARRRGIDSKTGKPPRTHASRENLRRYHQDEPKRLERYFNTLMETYENGFGLEAADAFTKFLRAKHAGVKVQVVGEVTGSDPRNVRKGVASPTKRRSPTILPVPKPLPEAIKAGHFGQEDGKPIHPSPREVRAITEQHAEKLIDLLDALRQAQRHFARGSDEARTGAECSRLKNEVRSAVDKYAASFGTEAGERLEAYCRRQLLTADRPHRSR